MPKSDRATDRPLVDEYDEDNPGSPIDTELHDHLQTDDLSPATDADAPGYPEIDPDADLLAQMGRDDNADDVPDEFTFTTTEDEDYDEDDRANRPLTIALDGIKVKIYRPSDSALALRTSAIINASDDTQRLLAMIGLLEAALDPATATYIKNQMLIKPAEGKRFRNDIIGKLVELILRKWGSDKAAAAAAEAATKSAPKNRKERRDQERGRK